MLRLEYKDYTLDFKFDAGTSRGVMTQHAVVYIKIFDDQNPTVWGLGEAAPLLNLSPDKIEEVKKVLEKLPEQLKKHPKPENEEEVFHLVKSLISYELPSLRMAMETALLDLMNGGNRQIFHNEFFEGSRDIPINGLIWMGSPEFMREQIREKLASGFKCIKMKIGAIDFDQELELIKILREESEKLIIRVDANGAFATNSVFKKIAALEPYNIHSIEQPIMAGQVEAMQLLCKRTTVPIALDEELIGIMEPSQKHELLRLIRPQYIILKPTLLGGFSATLEWIKIAEQMNIGWWLTSALESNIGLNAIAQFAGNFSGISYQGLGTGQLYHNNIQSPLVINGAFLGYDKEAEWGEVF